MFNLEVRNLRIIVLALKVMALVKFVQLVRYGAVLSSIGSWEGVPVAVMVGPFFLIGAELAAVMFALTTLRRRQEAGLIVALAAALLSLPTLAFPLSLTIFWFLVPSEISNQWIEYWRQSASADKNDMARH